MHTSTRARTRDFVAGHERAFKRARISAVPHHRWRFLHVTAEGSRQRTMSRTTKGGPCESLRIRTPPSIAECTTPEAKPTQVEGKAIYDRHGRCVFAAGFFTTTDRHFAGPKGEQNFLLFPGRVGFIFVFFLLIWAIFATQAKRS